MVQPDEHCRPTREYWIITLVIHLKTVPASVSQRHSLCHAFQVSIMLTSNRLNRTSTANRWSPYGQPTKAMVTERAALSQTHPGEPNERATASGRSGHSPPDGVGAPVFRVLATRDFPLTHTPRTPQAAATTRRPVSPGRPALPPRFHNYSGNDIVSGQWLLGRPVSGLQHELSYVLELTYKLLSRSLRDANPDPARFLRPLIGSARKWDVTSGEGNGPTVRASYRTAAGSMTGRTAVKLPDVREPQEAIRRPGF